MYCIFLAFFLFLVNDGMVLSVLVFVGPFKDDRVLPQAWDHRGGAHVWGQSRIARVEGIDG